MKNMPYAVILAGGRGERFWPLSTSRTPKQVLSLLGKKPMIQIAAERIRGVVPDKNIMIITGKENVKQMRECAKFLPAKNVIGEPFGRDTAAACALAWALVRARNKNAVMCVLTADHIIGKIPIFRKTLSDAFKMCRDSGKLVTIGIKPRFPSTGFGYIRAGKKIPLKTKTVFRSALKFVEKPGKATAEKYMKSGRYFWNSGMFVWTVQSFENELRKHAPELWKSAVKLSSCRTSEKLTRSLRLEYGKLKRISIDYALLEKSDNIAVAEGKFAWDDVGTWQALENHFKRDAKGNVLIGKTSVLDSEDNVVFSRERLTALIGVKDVVVVQAPGATLVCGKDMVQKVKDMVKKLSARSDCSDLI